MTSIKELDKVAQNSESLLLDSRLITGVRFLKYDYKIVRCGDYTQVYFYSESKVKNDIKNLDIDGLNLKENKTTCVDIEIINKKEIKEKNENKIENRNIVRSKLSCQRLAKANAKDWQSFITLTYSKNMQNIKQAKTDLNFFIKNIKKVKSDFKYIAIIEFQKRGAIHFHLLSNLNIQDNNIIIKQKSNEKYYDVKYWNKGFTSFEPLNGDIKKIIGYISKYMTKECDERLFGVRRYTSSQNLIKPYEDYIDSKNKKEYEYFTNLLKGKECIYTNSYQDNFENDIIFMEFK